MKKSIFKRTDKANWFLGLFIVLFLVMVARVVVGTKTDSVPLVNATDEQVTVVSDKPVVLTFSDVLRRAGDIKSINIRDNDANGVLKDGTKFTAVISYDPVYILDFPWITWWCQWWA